MPKYYHKTYKIWIFFFQKNVFLSNLFWRVSREFLILFCAFFKRNSNFKSQVFDISLNYFIIPEWFSIIKLAYTFFLLNYCWLYEILKKVSQQLFFMKPLFKLRIKTFMFVRYFFFNIDFSRFLWTHKREKYFRLFYEEYDI